MRGREEEALVEKDIGVWVTVDMVPLQVKKAGELSPPFTSGAYMLPACSLSLVFAGKAEPLTRKTTCNDAGHREMCANGKAAQRCTNTYAEDKTLVTMTFSFFEMPEDDKDSVTVTHHLPGKPNAVITE